MLNLLNQNNWNMRLTLSKPPPCNTIAKLRAFSQKSVFVTYCMPHHTYNLESSYGANTVCLIHNEWNCIWQGFVSRRWRKKKKEKKKLNDCSWPSWTSRMSGRVVNNVWPESFQHWEMRKREGGVLMQFPLIPILYWLHRPWAGASQKQDGGQTSDAVCGLEKKGSIRAICRGTHSAPHCIWDIFKMHLFWVGGGVWLFYTWVYILISVVWWLHDVQLNPLEGTLVYSWQWAHYPRSNCFNAECQAEGQRFLIQKKLS